MDGGRVGVDTWRTRPKDLLRLKEEKVVVVAASGKELSVRAPSDATDLLGVTADPCQQCHATVPVEEIPLILIRPFDRVEVDVANFIADQELFRVDEGVRVAHRTAALCSGSEADVRDRCGLFAVETWITIQRAPKRDSAIATPDGEDG